MKINRKEFLRHTTFAFGSMLPLGGVRAFQLTKNKSEMKIANPQLKNICATCGTRYARSKFDVHQCPICLDDRQYLRDHGQQWVSYAELKDKHAVKISQLRQDIYALQITPNFAIAQRAHLLVTPRGNVLWDCIPLLDEASVEFVRAKGGLSAIAISHPHYYSLMQEWARAFDCPIYLHQADRNWIMDEETEVAFWQGSAKELLPGVMLVHTGGHFPGSAVLHYQPENERGSLFLGDSLYLSRDGKHLSAMQSYPNVIPLPPEVLFGIFRKLMQLKFDNLFGAFDWQAIQGGAQVILQNSLERYQRIYA